MIQRLILGFLRCFPQFRSLEADRDSSVIILREANAELEREKLLLQDRLDAMQTTVDHLWEMTRERQAIADQAMQMQVNFATQQKFGMTPYPEAVHLPPSAEPDLSAPSVLSRPRRPSELVAAQTRQFMQEFKEKNTRQA